MLEEYGDIEIVVIGCYGAEGEVEDILYNSGTDTLEIETDVCSG
jgi:hypothetical protein